VTELKQESMYELVTRIQKDISCLKQGQRDLRQEMSSVRGQVHLLQVISVICVTQSTKWMFVSNASKHA